MEHNDIINMSNHGGLGSDHVTFYINGCFLGEPAVNVFQGDIPPGCPFVVESVKLFSSWNDWNPGWGKRITRNKLLPFGKVTQVALESHHFCNRKYIDSIRVDLILLCC